MSSSSSSGGSQNGAVNFLTSQVSYRALNLQAITAENVQEEKNDEITPIPEAIPKQALTPVMQTRSNKSNNNIMTKATNS